MNQTVISGRVVKNLSLRKTPGGDAVTSFILAVDRKNVGKDAKEKVDFITCVAWRNKGIYCCNNLRQGTEVVVEGNIHTGRREMKGFKVIKEGVDTSNEDNFTLPTFEIYVDKVRVIKQPSPSTVIS